MDGGTLTVVLMIVVMVVMCGGMVMGLIRGGASTATAPRLSDDDADLKPFRS